MKLWTWILAGMMVLAAMLASPDAEAARRLGGGKSMGRQSANVTQREAANRAAPSSARPQQATAAPAAPAAATPAPRRPWGAMLGGLAAGLGLAWLAHSLGMGEAFGSFLLVALLVLAALAVFGALMRRRGPARSPYVLQGAGNAADAVAPYQYSPDHVGNDASARPWERAQERSRTALEPPVRAPESRPGAGGSGVGGSGVKIGSALAGPQGWGIPAGFDVTGFLDAARRNFVTLQDAWDRADVPTLRSMMTDDMVGEIRTQLAEREQHLDGQPNKTEVVMLEAQLLGIEDLGQGYMASVEYSGLIREQPSADATPFREVWNMTKPKSGTSGWLVAGVQALQ